MLFIMRGTSCSGKDTFISEYFDHLPYDKCNILSSDDFRQMLFGNVAEQRHNEELFSTLYKVLESRLIHRAEWTVINSTNLKISDIRTPIELCKKYHTPFTILSLQPPSIEELISRNAKRSEKVGFNIPDTVLEKHWNRYFNCIDSFIQEAVNNEYCSLIEFDQNYEVLRHV